MFRFIVLLAVLACVAAFMAPATRSSSISMMATTPNSKFIKKVAAPAAPAKKAAAAPVKKAAPAPVKKAAPAPVKKAAPAPVKKAAPAPVKKAAPAPVKKFVAPAPVKKAAPAPKFVAPKSEPKASFVASSSFAGGLVGADLEAGEFDPFGLSVGKSQETLEWYRAAELKHARICMLASVGLLVQPAFHLPDPVFESTKGYGAVIQLLNERPEAVWQILIALAAIETTILFRDDLTTIPTDIKDFNFDPFGVRKSQGLDDPDKFAAMQLRELKNGRLAMLGVAGTLLQEYVSGGKGVYEL